MIVECPHCYSKVMPSVSGECPSCRHNIHDLQDVEPEKTALTISSCDRLPPVCCDCGNSTQRYVTVTRKVSHKKEPDSGAGVALILGMLVSWIFWIVAAVKGLRTRTQDLIIVELPQCELCGTLGPPAPIRVNSEELHMTFVVNQKLKQQVQAERELAGEA